MKKLISIILCIAMLSNCIFVLAQDEVTSSDISPEIFEQKDYIISIDSPAENTITGWKNKSLPIGNGYMGVSLFHDVASDRLQITEQSIIGSSGQESMADLYIDTNHSIDTVENYSRQLVLNNGVATMSYTYEDIDYKREYFSSYPDKVTVIKLSASGEGNLNFTLRPEISYENPEEVGDLKTGTVVAEGDTITLAGNAEYYNVNFEAQFKVILEGSGEIVANNETDDSGNVDNGTLTVSGADCAYVIFAVGTNYELKSSTFTNERALKLDGSYYPHEKVTEYMNSASAKTYDELLSTHKADFEGFFNRVVFDIGGKFDGRTVAELKASSLAGTHEKYLEELIFQMGRYMMICSSRDGTLPPGLQAIWNVYEDGSAPWTAGYWYNVNQQMNYWPTFTTNLLELYKPYSDFNLARLEQAEINGDGYIKKYYPEKYEEGTGKNGWLVGTGNSAYTVASANATGHSGPGTGGFTAISDMDYYRYTKDPEVLNRTYITLESLARFYVKCVDEYDGLYLATLSASPEMKIGGVAYRTIGCAFDQQMIYETNKTVVDIYDEHKDILENPDTELIETIRGQLDKYDYAIIGYSGQIKEYREEDYYADIGDANHRHISQLVGLYPGTSINDDTPAWVDGAKVTLAGRATANGKSWSAAHKLCLWARAGGAESAYGMVKRLTDRHTLDNMWSSHHNMRYDSLETTVFQADANFGATAGIAEMLLQSQGEYVEILPALPSAWTEGEYKGLVARGNFDVNVSWTDGIASKVEVKSNAGETLKLNYYNIANATITDEKGNAVSFTSKDKDHIEVATNAGDKIVITNIPSHTITANVADVLATADNGKATVTWTASTATGATYKIYRAFESAPTYELLAEGVTGTTFTDENRNGRQATYKITAVANGMEESGGGTSTVIPDAKPVTEITAFMADDTHLQLQWTAPEKADGYKIYEKTEEGYTLLSETEYLVAIIPDADTTKTYSISSTYYNGESEKTDITIGEKVDNVSKAELYNYMQEINNLENRGFLEADIDSISDDIETVKVVWADTETTAEDVESAVKLSKEILEKASYFPFNVVLNKKISFTGSTHDGYPITSVNDGDYSTRVSSRAKDIISFEIELDSEFIISDFEVTDYRNSSGSRGDDLYIYGLASNGRWLEMLGLEDITDLAYSGSVRTINGASSVSVPVSRIKVIMKNTDDYLSNLSIYEVKAIGAKPDARPKINSVTINPDKPALSSGATYKIIQKITNGCMLHCDNQKFLAYHMGKGFEGLTQISLPVYDSDRTSSTALAEFLQGDNTYFTFNANSDGKVYININSKVANLSEDRGWTLISSTLPTLPSDYSSFAELPCEYTFEDKPYYITRVQLNNDFTAISSVGSRIYTYVKSFSAYENVEVPTIGFRTKENYFVAVELNGKNSNTNLDYIFYGDEMVKTTEGQYEYTFDVDTASVSLSALAKNPNATVSFANETLDLSRGFATTTATVTANDKTTVYTLNFNSTYNIALNKSVTVSPKAKDSYPATNITDGDFTTRYVGSGAYCPVVEIDLNGSYTVSAFDIAEFRNPALFPKRIDNLSIYGYINEEWVLLKTGIGLDGEVTNGYSKTNVTLDASVSGITKLKFDFVNTGYVNGYEIAETQTSGSQTNEVYAISGTSKRDCSINEIAVYGIEDTKYGDVTRDGEINATDILYLAKYVAGYKSIISSADNTTLKAADVTHDGKITSADILKLIRYWLGFDGITLE